MVCGSWVIGYGGINRGETRTGKEDQNVEMSLDECLVRREGEVGIVDIVLFLVGRAVVDLVRESVEEQG